MGCGRSKLSKKDLLRLEKATGFNVEEIQEWHKGFKKDCPRGRLTKDKFTEVYTNFLTGNAEEFCYHVFRSFDKDMSGYIEFSEFLFAISITSNKCQPEIKQNWAFDLYDIDGNGYIRPDELQEVIASVHKMMGLDSEKDPNVETPLFLTNRIFFLVDKDKDANISKDEFNNACLQAPVLLGLLSGDFSAPLPSEIATPVTTPPTDDCEDCEEHEYPTTHTTG